MANKNSGLLANTAQEEPCGDCSKIWLSFIFALMIIYYFESPPKAIEQFSIFEMAAGVMTQICVYWISTTERVLVTYLIDNVNS